MKTKEAAQV